MKIVLLRGYYNMRQKAIYAELRITESKDISLFKIINCDHKDLAFQS